MATGVPNPAAPSKKRAEAEGNQQRLHPLVGRDGRHRSLDDLELAGANGQVVEKHRGEHDPADGQQSETAAVGRRGQGRRERHLEDPDRHCQARWPGRPAPPAAPTPPRPTAPAARRSATRPPRATRLPNPTDRRLAPIPWSCVLRWKTGMVAVFGRGGEMQTAISEQISRRAADSRLFNRAFGP